MEHALACLFVGANLLESWQAGRVWRERLLVAKFADSSMRYGQPHVGEYCVIPETVGKNKKAFAGPSGLPG